MKHLFLLLSAFCCMHFANTQTLYCAGGAFYRFLDSSVPPEYHRSYTIRVECDKVCFTIDSYGDTLLNEEYKIDISTTYKNFLYKLKTFKLKTGKSKKEDGCTGGTSDIFVVHASLSETDPNKKFKIQLDAQGSVYHCGGTDYGNVKGKINEAKVLFQSMVPDFELKLGGTRTN